MNKKQKKKKKEDNVVASFCENALENQLSSHLASCQWERRYRAPINPENCRNFLL